jgi:threonine aldolase
MLNSMLLNIQQSQNIQLAARQTSTAHFLGKPNRANPYNQLNIPTQDEFTKSFEGTLLQTVTDAFKTRYSHNRNFDFAGDNFGPADMRYCIIGAAALQLPHWTYQREGPVYEHAQKVFKKQFGGTSEKEPVVTFFVPTGTAGNRLSMSPILKTTHSIIFADNAHGLTRETGAYHRMNSASAVGLPTQDGKLTPNTVSAYLKKLDPAYPNVPQPKVISISQPTEDGTLYTQQEVKALANLAHKNGLLLQMDGARLFYAMGATGKSAKELTTDLGVDMVFIGGSKGGMVASEAIVFTPNYFKADNPVKEKALLHEMRSIAKQQGLNVGQAVFNMSQFIFAFKDNYAAKSANKAIQQTENLETELKKIPDIELYLPTETNALLVSMPGEVAKKLGNTYHFMTFKNRQLPPDKKEHVVVRFMTTPMTTNEQIQNLCNDLRKLRKDKAKL